MHSRKGKSKSKRGRPPQTTAKTKPSPNGSQHTTTKAAAPNGGDDTSHTKGHHASLSRVPMRNNLCEQCQDLVLRSRYLSRPYCRASEHISAGPFTQKSEFHDHHKELQALLLSARAGCHFCSIIWPSTLDSTYIDEQALKSYRLKLCHKEDATGRRNSPMIYLETDHLLPRTKIHHTAFPDCKKNTLTSCRRTDDAPVLQLAASWLQECQRTHDNCRALGPNSLQTSSFTPSRLVRITSEGKTTKSVRLVLGSEIDVDTKYLTLSHCWGGADITKLTESALASFQVDIPLLNLPKTFLDAFLVTLCLDFEYIWIDSLCIIQDSEDDWTTESKLMGDIFRNSQCTIAALKSGDSHGGLFTERLHLSLLPYELKTKDAQFSGAWVGQLSRDTKKPLYKRAWVVQERCLSRRLLEFGADEVSWECVRARASESKPYFGNDQSRSTRLTPGTHGILNTSTDLQGYLIVQSLFPRNWIQGWWNIVAIYNACDLTYPTDKIPAIAGLARLIEQTKSVSTIQGLWKPVLAAELLWFLLEPSKQVLDIDVPTWSWMNVHGQVDNGYHLRARRMEYVAHVAPRTDSPRDVSVVGLGYRVLDVHCRVLPVTCAPPIIGRTELGKETSKYPIRFCDNRDWQAEPESWDGEWRPDAPFEQERSLWALQIAWGWEIEYGVHFKNSLGLVVELTDQNKNAFKRVGYYHIKWSNQRRSDVTKIAASWSEEEEEHNTSYRRTRTWETRGGKRWFGERIKVLLV